MTKTSHSVACKVSVCEPSEKHLELILSGHGLSALAHIGVLNALNEKKQKVDRITGMSLGAVIAALSANGWLPPAILELFLDSKAQKLMRDAWLGSGKACRPAFSPVQDLLPVASKFVAAYQLVPHECLRIVCWDLSGKRTKVFDGTSYDLATALAAACAVPGLMRPVRQQNMLLVDCALHGCHVSDHFSDRTIVSSAWVSGDSQKVKFSHVDRILHRRQRLTKAKSPHVLGSQARCTTIDIAVPAETLAACDCSEVAVNNIVTAGYDAAIAALQEAA
jgi:hypothetical protein